MGEERGEERGEKGQLTATGRPCVDHFSISPEICRLRIGSWEALRGFGGSTDGESDINSLSSSLTSAKPAWKVCGEMKEIEETGLS